MTIYCGQVACPGFLCIGSVLSEHLGRWMFSCAFYTGGNWHLSGSQSWIRGAVIPDQAELQLSLSTALVSLEEIMSLAPRPPWPPPTPTPSLYPPEAGVQGCFLPAAQCSVTILRARANEVENSSYSSLWHLSLRWEPDSQIARPVANLSTPRTPGISTQRVLPEFAHPGSQAGIGGRFHLILPLMAAWWVERERKAGQ